MIKLYSYRGNEPYIFISYAHRDSASVYHVIEKMQSAGYRVWFDEGIDHGTEWDETIANSIQSCGYFIAFVSKNYLASANCKDELNYARDLDKKRLLVYIEDVSLPAGMAMRMNRIQSIFKHKYTDESDFYRVLYSSDGISGFSSEGNKKITPASAVSAEPRREEKTLKFSNGTYTGEVNAAGKMHGRGVYRFTSGQLYEGEFRDGQFCGQGTFRFPSGDVYDGGFLNSKRHGQGTFHYHNGDVYEGSFINDKKNGHGKYRFADGRICEAEYRDDKKNGYGVFRWPSGEVYEGGFLDDKRSGRGIDRYANGDVYDGDFLNGVRHGHGVYRFANGNVYEGEYRDDKRNGHFTVRYADGKVREGKMIDGDWV